MINRKLLLGAKYVVGLTWLLGLLEIVIDVTAIPTSWVWLLVVVSLVLHFFQAIYFYLTFRSRVEKMPAHILQIMLFGMAHVLSMKLTTADKQV